MTISPLDNYIISVRSANACTPAMIDEDNIFIFLSEITGNQIISYEDLIEASISNIFVYDIPEGKKEFSIATIRECITDIDLMPYEGKNIYILRHFSTATLEAQNALLKMLEECPSYAIILLEVENPNAIIETIRSRVIDLSHMRNLEILSSSGKAIIELYRKKQYHELAKLLYTLKCSRDEAILILQGVYPYLSEVDMPRCDFAIESLASTHENPRSLLDIFFL